LVRLHHKSFVGGERDEFLTRMNFTHPLYVHKIIIRVCVGGGGVQIHALISSSFDGFFVSARWEIRVEKSQLFLYIFCSTVLKINALLRTE
jgi:hypothetical protein